jgi:hypothetical protein
MSLGFAGEQPVSDRDAVIKELQAQGNGRERTKTIIRQIILK